MLKFLEYTGADATKMELRAVETAEFLSFGDKLFDSVNGSSKFNRSGKILRTSVDVKEEENVHTQFWKEAIKILDSTYCVNSTKRVVPPTIKNWKITLKNLLLLRTSLKSHGFNSFKPRLLNQDPLENFFGKIRQRGQRFINPTCSAFGQFYKSLLVNNLVSKHSVGSNCEDDNSNILLPLQKFIEQVLIQTFCRQCILIFLFFTNKFHYLQGLSKSKIMEQTETLELTIPEDFNQLKPLEEAAVAYVGGYIVKTKFTLKQCHTCCYNVLRRDNEDIGYLEDITKSKDLGGVQRKRLTYCNKPFIINLLKVYNIVRYILNIAPSAKGLLICITNVLYKHIDFNFKECSHTDNLFKSILHDFTKVLIYNYFNGVNNILNGKDNRKLPDVCPELFKEARKK